MKPNTLLKKNDKEIITILELPELYSDALVKSGVGSCLKIGALQWRTCFDVLGKNVYVWE